ncbi:MULTISPECIES: hypothetical protein [unclassified Halorubrum]|uniref:hypothetical protein n=1 Tax=unclassified Halorubrum TaxID=2642239 RepID=UPI00113FEAAC|nr:MULTISPECIES: hypothetical protein [unclassified Halorubrum]
MITDYGLKEDDVEFLSTVKQIEENPTEYDNTDPGETVANVTVLKQVSGLSKNQIDYRAREGDDSRGLADDGLNLIRSHGPRVEGKGFGPRSVELTDKGHRVVAEIKESRSSGDGREGGSGAASSAEIEELRTEVSELRETVENLSEDMETIKQNRTGAIGGNLGAKLEAIARAFPQQNFVLTEVLGIDMDAVAAADIDDEQALRELRVSAYNHLTESIDEADSEQLDPPVESEEHA